MAISAFIHGTIHYQSSSPREPSDNIHIPGRWFTNLLAYAISAFIHGTIHYQSSSPREPSDNIHIPGGRWFTNLLAYIPIAITITIGG
eukprot:CAMPEP_0194127660 /NCGR_PEP_ID=MMETSP0150-20130528/60640_1 /TAXON_ID=122233 /ORGANISM="Chaetoceros debilis, Strain MM31A-1" /LENGTH=87 /DNA_ID=CAMNT_0038821601 /DNA_START=2039 /DNA_END=2302 /DNA_ORIENTATION=-